MHVVITQTHAAPGKLADAELWFTDGPLAGLRLVGFAVWEPRSGSTTLTPNVTFPSRQYGAADKRSFALLRPQPDTAAGEQIRTLILSAYAAA